MAEVSRGIRRTPARSVHFLFAIKATVTPAEFWIKNNNNVLAPHWPRIAAEYTEVMQELPPRDAFPV